MIKGADIVEYDMTDTIKVVREFSVYPHSEFWGSLFIAGLQKGADIAMSYFWEHARNIGGRKFPLKNDLWRKAVATYEFKNNRAKGVD